MRLEKRKSNDIAGMENHNERKTENHSNCDIDLGVPSGKRGFTTVRKLKN